ncbi:MAG TPA: polyprenyl synthetase family protein, partial [bacterium]|nr:polyprenyl synthetase family protein [bacterium]
ILDLASAVEILHTYSLIHDDLPSMDDDDYRRGRLSCHKKFSEAAAVLAGDALLTLGMKLLSRDAKAAEILGEALGADGMIRGQALDIENNPSKTKKSRAARIILDIHLNKTAKFIGACAETGAYLAGQNPGRMRALREYGLAVGMAFQIRDDLLDLKEPGWNYPKIFGVRKAEEKVKAYTETALNKISFIGERGRMLEEIALKMSRRIS